MADKKRELETINVVIKHASQLRGFANISAIYQERPDFLFRKDNQIIGLEHIEIPILPVKNQDAEKLFNNKTLRLYNKRKDNYNEDLNGTLKDVESLINEKLKVYSDFTHLDYLQNCTRLLGIQINVNEKRHHNATAYINLNKEQYPDCDIKIGFVLDIGYDREDISNFQYRESPYHVFHKQRCLDYPFTYVFLALLGLIKDVYDFYIIWHPYDDYKSKYVKFYEIHFDSNRNVLEHNISKIWWEFDMPEAMKRSIVNLNIKPDE